MGMTEFIFSILQNKGIEVPDHHRDMLLGQWQAFADLRERSGLEKLADEDIGLQHVPGSDRHES